MLKGNLFLPFLKDTLNTKLSPLSRVGCREGFSDLFKDIIGQDVKLVLVWLKKSSQNINTIHSTVVFIFIEHYTDYGNIRYKTCRSNMVTDEIMEKQNNKL